jgi:hypothetical protein
LYRVFEIYGVPQWTENDLEKLYTYTFHDDEHIGTICKFLAIKGIAYDRDRFICKELPYVEPKQRIPGKWVNNRLPTAWVVQ